MYKNRPSYKINSQKQEVVLGTAGLGGIWRDVDREMSIETILYALTYGVYRLDTAAAYRDAEEIVGEALDRWKGNRPFISTKVGRLRSNDAFDIVNDYRIPVMQKSIAQSMEKLRCSELDLVFLHEPEMVPKDKIGEVVDFLVKLKTSDKVKAIGFGGIPTSDYEFYIKEGMFDAVMGYNNLDACCLDGMQKDVPFFKRHGLTLYQGSALHMGLLGNRFKKYLEERPDWIPEPILQNAEKAISIAERLQIKLSELAHRFILSIDEVDHLVIGPRTLGQLKDTLADCKKGRLEEDTFNELIQSIA